MEVNECTKTGLTFSLLCVSFFQQLKFSNVTLVCIELELYGNFLFHPHFLVLKQLIVYTNNYFGRSFSISNFCCLFIFNQK